MENSDEDKILEPRSHCQPAPSTILPALPIAPRLRKPTKPKPKPKPKRVQSPEAQTPYYERALLSPNGYLVKERQFLLISLPSDHRLRQRCHSTRGTLLPNSHNYPPPLPRPAFTAAELQSFKFRRRPPQASDPDDASTQLQRSQLVHMWNADYDSESQWAEYGAVQKAMVGRRRESGLPTEAFDSVFKVNRKRRRVISNEYARPVRMKAWTIEEEEVMEDGEILDKPEHDEDVAGGVSILQRIEEDNERLVEENGRLKEVLLQSKERLRSRGALTAESDASLPLSPPTSPLLHAVDKDNDSDLEVEVDELDIGNLDDVPIESLEEMNNENIQHGGVVKPSSIEEVA